MRQTVCIFLEKFSFKEKFHPGTNTMSKPLPGTKTMDKPLPG